MKMSNSKMKWLVAWVTFLDTVLLGYLLYWITHPERSMVFVVGVIISVALYLFMLFSMSLIKRTKIILIKDAFAQTVVGGVTPWKDIDLVEYYPGKHRKGLTIYYRKDNQIKNLAHLMLVLRIKNNL